MARLLLVPSSSTMALKLLLVVVVLSNVPSSAPAASSALNPLVDLVKPTNNSATTPYSSSSTPLLLPNETNNGGGGKHAPPVAVLKDEDGDGDIDAEDKRKKAERKEKQLSAERELQKEYLQYAKEKGLVSPTNGMGSYKGIARDFLDAHNEARARYGVPPVKWDKKLARQARRWSNAMRKDCQLLHSGGTGESVFRSHDDWNATAKDAVTWWSKEEPIYDKNTEKCTDGRLFKECGHFALIVGKRSHRIGCARAECFKGGVFITCNYLAKENNSTTTTTTTTTQ